MSQIYPRTGSQLWTGSNSADENAIRSLALQYSKQLLCEDSENSEHSAALFESNSHPDFKLIEPEPDKRVIKIDWIRELIEWSHSKPLIASLKIAVLFPADAMNLQAANAFLKTLEEPNPNTLFLLVTERPHLLPTTIRSRCHIVRHRTAPPDYKIIHDQVRTQVQDDLQALKTNLAEPISIAARWLKNDVNQVFHWLMIVLCDFTNSANDDHLIKSRRWWRFMDQVIEARRALEERTQANTQLLVEALLIQYARIMTR